MFVERHECPTCGAVPGRWTQLLDLPYEGAPLDDYLRRMYGGADLSVLAGGRFVLVRCGDCGLVFQVQVPAQPLLETLYNEWIGETAREAQRARHSAQDYRYLAQQVDWLLRHLGKPPRQVCVLDFGMGWGEFLQMARAYGCEVTGCELSQVRIDHARSLGIPVRALDEMAPDSFDFINSEQVFEHLTQPAVQLAALARLLKPHGLLKFSVPDGRGVDALVRRALARREWNDGEMMIVSPLEHVNCFDHASIVRFASRHGLRVAKVGLRQMIESSSGWLSPRELLRAVARPLYRFVYPKSSYVLLERAS